MLQDVRCPCVRKNGIQCNRYLGQVEGLYNFKCPFCKGRIKGNTLEGWVKIVRPAEK